MRFKVYFRLYAKKSIFEQNKTMKAILTGDIINSREQNPQKWLAPLKQELIQEGKTPKHWEIFRGDSFQLQTTPEKALLICFKLKATLKQHKNLDIRIGVGIGSVAYETEKIAEANGEAFINSGACFESLKKQTLAFKTPWEEFTETLNTMLSLFELTANSWSTNTSLVVKTFLDNPDKTQKEIALLLQKKQSNISTSLKRAGADELEKLLTYYKKQIQLLC